MTRILFLAIALLLSFGAFSHNYEKDPTFYKEHLDRKVYDIDTAAIAVVLFESHFYNVASTLASGGHLAHRVTRIIKILKKDAYHYGDVSFIINGSVKNTSARVYLLEDGKMVVKDMPNTSIRQEHVVKQANSSSGVTMNKFSIPSLKEGCIIEYTYETQEDLSTVFAEWEIQETIPKLHSEMTVGYPDILRFAVAAQNGPPFVEISKTKASDTTVMPESYSLPAYQTSSTHFTKKWVRTSIRPILNEPMVYNHLNYAERLELQIVNLKMLTSDGRHLLKYHVGVTSWQDLSRQMSKNMYAFGALEQLPMKAVKDLLAKIPKDADTLTYARDIYKYVRDKFNLTGQGSITPSRELEWILNNTSGNGMDLHLSLVALLRTAGFRADPVMLGTRGRLRPMEDYPVIDRINYVVTRLKYKGEEYFLDPTEKNLAFGSLLPFCYNGFGWVVRDTGFRVQLPPQSLKEKTFFIVRTTSVDSASMVLNVKHIMGKVSSYEHREEWQKDSLEARKELLTNIKELSLQAKLLNCEIVNLWNPDTSLILQYDIKLQLPKNTDIVFSPAMFNYFTSNPFKADRRQCPVEMPYALDMTYNMVMKLPQNYTVQELPKATVLKLDEWDSYKYSVNYDEGTQSLMVNTKLNFQQTYFDVESYTNLKGFFDKMIESQQQAVLITKKK